MLPPDDTLNRWISSFASALSRGDFCRLLELFWPDACWRDLLAFTWNIHTAEGRPAIGEMLWARLAETAPHAWRADGPAREGNGIIEANLTFETAVARCQAVVRLRVGRCWMLTTSLRELKGHEETAGVRRPFGPTHGSGCARDAVDSQGQPYCLIVGAGHSGLALGSRLKQLGVPTLIIEKNARPGDTWRNRYDGLHVHTPVWYDHMPYLPYPETWPVFASKDQIGVWLDSYADVMALDVWTATECRSAVFDDLRDEWRVEITRNTRSQILRPKHLVVASGFWGVPHLPDVPGMGTFDGEQVHASAFHDARTYCDRRCVVIGSGNSAHDICAELWRAGADVTMVQRSPTMVMRLASVLEVLADTYSEAAVARGMTAENADLLFAATPHRLLAAMQIQAVERIREKDATFYDGLARAGFRFHFGADGTGIIGQLYRQAAGYYLDVGASGLVVDGSIKLKSGAGLSAVTQRGVVLTDGTELPVDLIVYATGFEPPTARAAQILLPEVIRKVGRIYGLGSDTRGDPGPWEGEPRNLWKPTLQRSLWFAGAGFAGSRFFSRVLALQIKARQVGLATPVYALPPAVSPDL